MISGVIWELAGWVSFAVKILAFIDLPKRPAEAFPFLNRQTKNTWYAIVIASVLTHILLGAWGLFGIVGLIACGIYLADIKPKIAEMQSNSRW
jgi:succinate dehydrogenase hydrophobic anchor subunit